MERKEIGHITAEIIEYLEKWTIVLDTGMFCCLNISELRIKGFNDLSWLSSRMPHWWIFLRAGQTLHMLKCKEPAKFYVEKRKKTWLLAKFTAASYLYHSELSTNSVFHSPFLWCNDLPYVYLKSSVKATKIPTFHWKAKSSVQPWSFILPSWVHHCNSTRFCSHFT